ncbi:MAG: hypothetical protein ACMUIG_06115 [Thermoplasmatota archaeon]
MSADPVKYTNLDHLVVEFLSFQLYRSGKDPMSGLDPRKRVSRRIWREEGIDLEMLSGTGVSLDEMAKRSTILDTEDREIRATILRLKRRRTMLIGIGGLAGASENLLREKPRRDELLSVRSLCRSELIRPLMLSLSGVPLKDALDSHTIPRNEQVDHTDISPLNARRILLGTEKRSVREEDISILFRKKVGRDLEITFRSGMGAVSLSTLISGIMGAEDGELTELIRSPALVDFVSKGLRSPVLEASFSDLIRTYDGSSEEGSNFRTRFGRYIMESPLADQVVRELIEPRIDRLINCTENEANRLSGELIPYMDHRSVRTLLDVLYRVPNENRPALISLMAATGSRDVVEPLRRLYEYSNLKNDRISSKNALLMLGIRV